MLISCDWLGDLIDVEGSPSDVGERLTMAGLTLDGVERAGDDTILELDVTANRGDCLSHLGVARELAVIQETGVRLPDFTLEEGGRPVEEAFSISIADADLCRRYCGRLIADIKVGPSPGWLVARLEALGIRPINNVADVTNYVLMELGHPLHAFDRETLRGSEIIVRRADVDETLETLDGEKRDLDPSMLVIADAERPVALAGIMGGAETEISATTRTVLLESAWFDPNATRRTARGVHLNTDASYRFERGADVEMARFACDRAAGMIQELTGGTISKGMIDVYPGRQPARQASLRRRRIRQYLGMEVPDEAVQGIFERLGFKPNTMNDDEGWTLTVPEFRHDISSEEDLMEEIARHFGYDRFPSTLPAWSGQGQRLPWHAVEAAIRGQLSGLGYSEACTIAFSDRETEAAFEPDADPVAIRNPLSDKAPILRTSLVPSMLRSVQWNLNRGSRDLEFYEIAKTYPKAGEYRRLILAGTGLGESANVHRASTDFDFFRLKGDVEALLGMFDVPAEGRVEDIPRYLHPGRSMRIGSVALLGELHADILKRFKLRQKVYIAVIAIEELYRAGLRDVAAREIPKYPAVRRDLSLLVDRKLRYSEVVEAIHAAEIAELIDVYPFDRLEEGPFPTSCYSLAIGLAYRAGDRTLKDEEVDGFDRRILAKLEQLGVGLRGETT